MTTMLQLPNIDTKHLAGWYAVLHHYHTNPESTMHALTGLFDIANKLPQDSSPKATESPYTLYKDVIEKCTCGLCYQALAQPDRIPWFWRAELRMFTNAKHGTYKPDESCNIKSTESNGWIFESRATCSLAEARTLKIVRESEVAVAKFQAETTAEIRGAELKEAKYLYDQKVKAVTAQAKLERSTEIAAVQERLNTALQNRIIEQNRPLEWDVNTGRKDTVLRNHRMTTYDDEVLMAEQELQHLSALKITPVPVTETQPLSKRQAKTLKALQDKPKENLGRAAPQPLALTQNRFAAIAPSEDTQPSNSKECPARRAEERWINKEKNSGRAGYRYEVKQAVLSHRGRLNNKTATDIDRMIKEPGLSKDGQMALRIIKQEL